MGMYRLELKIPGLPSSGNGKLGDHYIVQWEENKKWHQLVHLHSLRSGLPLKPLNRARLSLVRHGSLSLDYDNLVTSFKSVVDGLVEAKIIADDSFEVTGQWDVTQVKSKRKETHILIVVQEIAYDGPDVKNRRQGKTRRKTTKTYYSRRRR